MPFGDYIDPVGQPAAAPAVSGDPTDINNVWQPAREPQVGYGEDIAKGTAGGLGRGTAGLLGLPGNVAEYGARGIDWAARKVGGAIGVDVTPREARAPTYGSADVQKAMEDYTGPFYEPKTLPGQFASTIGEFAPAALIPGGGSMAARAFNTVVPAVASETAGQFTKGTAAEPWARGIAGLAAGPIAGKIVTPTAAPSAARQANVGMLEAEGIPVTAGQRTGSKPIQWAEATAADMPFSAGRAREMTAEQAAAYDRAVTQRLYDPAQLTARGVPEGVNLPDPRVVTAGRQSLNDEYDRILGQNTFRSDPQLLNDFHGAQTNYHNNVLPSARAGGARDIEQVHNEIVDKLVAGQGSMPGTEYQALRSRLGTLAQGSAGNDPYLANALSDTRGALDRAMARGLPPQDAAALALTNQRWGNMRQIEGAVARGGENLSPQAVAQTARVGRPGQYAARTGSLDPLAAAASSVIKSMPQSGTASRLGWQQLFNIPSIFAASGGAGAGGLVGGPIGAAVGAAAPFIASRLALSKPGQAYLANQVLPQNARDIIAQALMQQAISQPGGIEKNQAARSAYEQKRQEDLRKAGLQ